MVYGRYNYSFHGGYFMVYKPTNIDIYIYYGLFIAYRYIRNGIVHGTMVLFFFSNQRFHITGGPHPAILYHRPGRATLWHSL